MVVLYPFASFITLRHKLFFPFSASPIDKFTDYVSNRYPKNVLREMDKLRKRGQFTDVTLVSGDYRALCHRNVLAAASPYFNTMFMSNLSESRSDTVTLQIDPVTLGLVVDYMYSGEMKITVDNVQTLVETSDLLMLDNLKAACDQFMSERVDKTDRVEMYKFSLIYL